MKITNFFFQIKITEMLLSTITTFNKETDILLTNIEIRGIGLAKNVPFWVFL